MRSIQREPASPFLREMAFRESPEPSGPLADNSAFIQGAAGTRQGNAPASPLIQRTMDPDLIQRSQDTGTYEPSSGDTWESIASKFSLSVQELIALNADRYRYNTNTGSVTLTDGTAASPSADHMLNVPNTYGTAMGTGDTGRLEYVEVEGMRFIKGEGDGHVVSPNDVDQGTLGDCSLMSGMAAIAEANPDAIQKLIHYLGEGRYRVTLYVDSGGFFNTKVKHYETVSNYFPGSNNSPNYAQTGDVDADGRKELWPMLLEKALAQYLGGYNRIESRGAGDMMEYLTGIESTYYKVANHTGEYLYALMYLALEADKPVTTGTMDTLPAGVDSDIKADHSYAVQSVDLSNKTISLYNPWGHTHIAALSISDFKKAFSSVYIMEEAPE